MFVEMMALLASMLLAMFLQITEPAGVEMPRLPKYDSARTAIVSNSAGAKKYADSHAGCDENDALHNVFVKAVSSHATAEYKKLLDIDGELREITQQKIDETLASVRKNKMCTKSLDIIAPLSKFAPEPLPGTTLEKCNSVKRNAANHKKAEKANSEFDKQEFKDLFPTCACERVKFLGNGVAGVVYEVKMNNGKPNLAIKIAECGTLNAEIYAQQKLEEAGVKWVNKFHRWGRSAGGSWDFYIMDMIDSDVKDAWNNPGGMSSAQIREVMRIALEATREMHYLGIAHADMKLDNMAFIEKKPNELKIIDFGWALPVTKENGLEAFVDYWGIVKTISNNAGIFNWWTQVFPGGAQPLFDILSEVSTQILDDNPMAQGTGGFPTRDFFSGKKVKDVTSVYEKLIEKFLALGWIDEKAKGMKTESAIGRLFNSLPPKKG